MNALTQALAERVANFEKQNAELIVVLEGVYTELTRDWKKIDRVGIAVLRSHIRAVLDNSKGEQS